MLFIKGWSFPSHSLLNKSNSDRSILSVNILFLFRGHFCKRLQETAITAVASVNNHPPITSEKTQTVFTDSDTVCSCCHKPSARGAATGLCYFQYNVLSNMFGKHFLNTYTNTLHHQIILQTELMLKLMCFGSWSQNTNRDREPPWGWFWCRLAGESLKWLLGWVLEWQKSFKRLRDYVHVFCSTEVISLSIMQIVLIKCIHELLNTTHMYS